MGEVIGQIAVIGIDSTAVVIHIPAQQFGRRFAEAQCLNSPLTAAFTESANLAAQSMAMPVTQSQAAYLADPRAGLEQQTRDQLVAQAPTGRTAGIEDAARE
ncbi:hypothetical protein AWB82_06242 [Caballeronia glebae]|uniref:Uncharacterized protein n=1 Tax=Caballeronia glebae TaxID=1777143 RepID=A0A158D4F9_9BURK|nr:hypothetical protein AWB82_06242 [Caballeronia glebae]